MGKKKTEFSPVSIEEMGFLEEPSNPEEIRVQIPRSWAPVTPDKLNLPKQHPIYADRQENQLEKRNWFPPERFSSGFPQETQFHGLEPFSADSSNSKGGNFENLAWKSQGGAGISSDLSMDSFRSLMALADAAATSTRSANEARQRNSNPFITIFNTPFEVDRIESNFTASPFANEDVSFAPNLWNKSSCAPDTYLCECFKTLADCNDCSPLDCEKKKEQRKGCELRYLVSQTFAMSFISFSYSGK